MYYTVAIKDTTPKAYASSSPIVTVGFWNLIIVLSMHGLYRRVKNMVGCNVHKYSALRFWRSWRRSDNL